MKAATGKGAPFPPHLRARLARYFPDLDLDAVRLHDGIPRYVRGGPRGYVDRKSIHLAPGAFRTSTSGQVDADLLALLAHELTHVRQYRDLGPWRFRSRYLREYVAGRLRGMGHDGAYRNISFERAAREVEGRVRRDFAARTTKA